MPHVSAVLWCGGAGCKQAQGEKSIRKSLLIKTSQKAGKSLKAGSAAAAALVVKLMSRLFFCSMQFFSVKRHGMLFYCQQQNLVKMVAIFTTYSFFMRPRPSMDISFTESKLYIQYQALFCCTNFFGSKR